jgi:hypothetical protein
MIRPSPGQIEATPVWGGGQVGEVTTCRTCLLPPDQSTYFPTAACHLLKGSIVTLYMRDRMRLVEYSCNTVHEL